ncbi:MAG: tetratricopeptide repeat protein [Verrucomicrobia bacterium]|nr:tetratricopeptide repeat protein [Verrucomicrobiota bacterium]
MATLKNYFFLTLFFSHLFCGLEAQDSSKTPDPRLYRQAQSAMIHRDFAQARESLRLLIKEGVREKMSSAQYADLLLTLIEAELELGNNESAIYWTHHLPEELEPHHQLQTGLLLSRAYQAQGQLSSAYLVLQSLEAVVPRQEWRGEDRALYTTLRISLDEHYHQTLQRAERAMEKGQKEEALSHYLEVWHACEERIFPSRLSAEEARKVKDQVQLRVGEMLYALNRFSECRRHFSPVRQRLLEDKQASPYLLRSLHLIGLCHLKEQNPNAALSTFQIYLQIAPPSQERSEVAWETSLLYLELGQKEQALHLISQLTREAAPALAHLSEMYLCRLELHANNFAQVEQRLHQLHSTLSPTDPLSFEVSFLQGEAALNQGHFVQAAQFYQTALKSASSSWKTDALHGLAWSYLNWAAYIEKEEETRNALFQQAAATFEAMGEDERAYLGLAHLFLLAAPFIGEEEAKARAAASLTSPERFVTKNGQAEALLLRAHLASSYLEREALYSLLTDEKFAKTAQYAQGWYRRGLNHYTQAEQMGGESALYALAEQALTIACPLMKVAKNPKTIHAYKFLAESYRKQGKKEKAHALLSALKDEEGAAGWILSDEILYLLGHLSAELNLTDADLYFEQLIEEHPCSPLAPKALLSLATLYFQQGSYAQAERLFLTCFDAYPSSSCAAEGLFWAAQCQERMRGPLELITNLRKELCERYPQSPLAAESFFRLYSFSDYLQGHEEAIKHLDQMSMRYPQSPFLVIAHYLKGLHASRHGRTESAAERFALAVHLFDQHWIATSIPANDLEYFTSIRYKALMELGLTHLAAAKNYQGVEQERALQAAKEALSSVVGELCDPSHPLQHLALYPNKLKNRDLDRVKTNSSAYLGTGQEPYPRLLEEAEFSLTSTLMALGEHARARQLMNTMLKRYHALGIEEGYYLSRIWYFQGKFALEAEAYEIALSCFYHSEESGQEGMLSDEQRLDLWMQESRTLAALGELDDAMLLLSRIINDESASPLRLEAMYQRAKLYALQGREELALKQLEATAKKSGPWAEQARRELETMSS